MSPIAITAAAASSPGCGLRRRRAAAQGRANRRLATPIGWTTVSGPYFSATTCRAVPAAMARPPSSQRGRLTRRRRVAGTVLAASNCCSAAPSAKNSDPSNARPAAKTVMRTPLRADQDMAR
ncbi:hypothetical protein AB0J63_15870 [Streptosporangium canum]|uniref:hypothetical protein n=1 Tax=Streptosporangium canum TaxID=324952 RepID=UPI003420D05F